MTTRESTPLLTQSENLSRSLRSRALTVGWGAIQWRKRWPEFEFWLDRSGSKGGLIGRRAR